MAICEFCSISTALSFFGDVEVENGSTFFDGTLCMYTIVHLTFLWNSIGLYSTDILHFLFVLGIIVIFEW